MAKKRVFISFDFDNDKDLRGSLLEQAERPESPFEFSDQSLPGPIDENWRKKARSLIKNSDLMIVICGKHTNVSKGVAAEITFAREEGTPYFLLEGRSEETCTKPPMARRTDKIHKGGWENLKRLIAEKSK